MINFCLGWIVVGTVGELVAEVNFPSRAWGRLMRARYEEGGDGWNF